MSDRERDWLRVVYGSGLEVERSAAGHAAASIAVRQTPPDIDLDTAPRREQRVRVTVVPSEPGLAWALYLFDAEGGGDRPGRTWWRVDPGTWQPLEGPRQCVAEGRGRVRVDVLLRRQGRRGSRSRLRFGAEAAL